MDMLYKGIPVSVCALLLLINLSSCTTFSTTTDFPPPDKAICGIPYYLPLGRIHIVGSTSAPAPDSSNQSGQQKPPGTTDSSGTTNSSTSDTTDQKSKSGASQYNVSMTPVFSADPSQLYYLKRNADYLYDDKISLSVNSSYLLSSTSGDSKDETAGIISAIISSIPRDMTIPTTPLPFDVTFDPTNPAELQNAMNVISAANFQLKVLDAQGKDLTAAASSTSGDTKAIAPPSGKFSGGDGVAFRLPTNYTVSLSSLKTVNPKISAIQNVILPNKKANYFLDSTRMPFSEKTTQLTFTNGMLTTFAQSVPSPILGFVGIPKSIITAVLPIPTASTPTQGTTKSTDK